jgi:hypothetical protein
MMGALAPFSYLIKNTFFKRMNLSLLSANDIEQKLQVPTNGLRV